MTKRVAVACAAALMLSTALPILPTGPWRAETALAQSAITFENLSYKGAIFEVRMPRIVVEGSTNSKADFEALFDAKATTPLSERLAKINARSISIPTIEITQNVIGGKQVTSYLNNVLRDVRAGVVAESTTASLTSKGGSVPKLEMSSMNMVLKGTDLPLFARYLLEKSAPNEPLRIVMAEQTLGKIDYKIDGIGTFTVAGGRMDNLKLRPLSEPLMDTALKLQAGVTTEAEKKAAAKFATEMLTSFSFANFEMNGLSGEGKDAKGQSNKVGLAKMTMAGGADVPGRFSMQGLSFDNPDAKIGVGDITFEGISVASALSVIGKAVEDTSFDDFDPAVLIPKIDLMRFAGITANMVERGKAPVKFSLGKLELKMSNHIGNLPANSAMQLDRFQMDIPPNPTDEGLKTLLRMGYKALDVSAGYVQTWEEATKLMKVSDFTVKAANMFSATMNAEIRDVAKELFSGDKAKAAVALLGVNAKSLSLNLVNNGVFEKAIEDQARQQKAKPDDLRAQIAAGAALMIPLFMGNHPSSKVLADAVGKFLASPKSLNVTATAQGGGIGAADFIASGNPMDLLKKVDFTANANQ
jgi:hypothetical protein